MRGPHCITYRLLGLWILLGLFCLLSLTAGCVLPGQVAAQDIQQTLVRTLDRHDTYVQADSTLTALERRVHLRDSQLLRLIVEEAAER